MIVELILMGLLGLIFGLILAYLSQKFKVRKDPKVEEVRAVLPGANCGACGMAGCDAFAEAVVAGKVPVDGCVPGQKAVAEKIANILGKPVETLKAEKKVPEVDKEKCIGCKACEKACKFDAIHVVGKKASINSSKCKKCLACVKTCPVKAIH
jgi:electron transport complex protein RnfB